MNIKTKLSNMHQERMVSGQHKERRATGGPLGTLTATVNGTIWVKTPLFSVFPVCSAAVQGVPEAQWASAISPPTLRK